MGALSSLQEWTHQLVSEGAHYTALGKLHQECGGRLVTFAGWQLPIQFAGVIAEHNWTRTSASLFDVSHMAILDINNFEQSAKTIEQLTPASLQNLTAGQMRYGTFTNDSGGIIDDFMATKIDPATTTPGRQTSPNPAHPDAPTEPILRIVANASRRETICALLRNHFKNALPETTINERTDLSFLALQGPKAVAVLSELVPEVKKLTFLQSASLQLGDTPVEISRSGYSGEDGFELAIAATKAEEIARQLLADPAVKPAGLGARDTLRLEAGLCLYGNDLDETTSPIEANLRWSIPKNRRQEANFAGAERILRELADGPTRSRVGIAANGRKPIREKAELYNAAGELVGSTTSGGFGPSCNTPVAMGYVKTELAAMGTPLLAKVRNKEVACTITKLPFVAHNYYRG